MAAGGGGSAGAPDERIGLIWSLAQGALAAQFRSIDELRARVGVLILGASTGTAFLAAQGLARAQGLPAGAWLAIGASVLLIVTCAYILLPREWAGQSVNADSLLRDIDADAGMTLDDLQRRLARFAQGHVAANESRLAQLYHAYTVALALLCLDFAGWFWVLAAG